MASHPTDGLLSTSNNRPVSYSAVDSGGGVTNGMLARPPVGDLRVVAQQMVDSFDPDEDIHDIVRGVRLDELVTLSQSRSAIHVFKQYSNLLASIYVPLVEYVKYIWNTWSNIFLLTLKFELSLPDWALTVFLALATTVILGILLLWCQFVNNPHVLWSRKQDKDIDPSDPTLFDALTEEQTEVAKKKLGIPIEESVNTRDLRVFDLEIAKFLLQLAAIVYRRDPIAIHETLEEITAGHKSSPPQSTPLHRSAAASSARRATMHRTSNADSSSPSEDDVRECAPGQLVRDIWGHDSIVANKIEEAFKNMCQGLEQSTIVKFCQKKHIDYEPVSELHSSSSAYCSFFWDNKSNWIVVAFKGTSITEYPDWVTDFTPTLINAHEFLPDGYGRLFKGFKARLYPSEVSPLGDTHPWDSIRYSLCKVAQKLSYMCAQEGKASQINVWFTGHSLGSALMTLAYTRAISTPSDFAGYPIVFRDCYAFATPIAADRVCSTKLNEALAAFPTFGAPVGHYPYARTLWRVRNASDVVATLLPHLGDRANLAEKFYKTNPGAFAHLGAEILMKDGPADSEVASPCDHFLGKPSDYDRLPWPVDVEVHSGFTSEEIKRQREKRLAEPGEARREAGFKRAEKIPLIGRFYAHGPAYYWEQLDRIAVSRCKWVKA